MYLCVGLSFRATHEEDHVDPQLLRLDNMLVAEGVTGPEKGTDSAVMSAVTRAASLSDVQESPIEHMDYRTKLAQIRQIYQAEFEKYEQVLNTNTVWWFGVVVSALASINKVNLHRARLVSIWATMSGFNSRCRTLISVCKQPATQGQLRLPSLQGR